MNQEDFINYMKSSTWESFKVEQVITDYSGHREFLNDKWVSAS